MKTIITYKKRFFNLLESTMGDVRPLINEQTSPPLPWGMKSEDWDDEVGTISNSKEVFGSEVTNVEVSKNDKIYWFYININNGVGVRIDEIPIESVNETHLNYIKQIISNLSKGLENSGYNDPDKDSYDIVKNLKNYKLNYGTIGFDYPENQPNFVSKTLTPKNSNSNIDYLYLFDKDSMTVGYVKYKNGVEKKDVKIKIQDNVLYLPNSSYTKPQELKDIKDFQRWLDQKYPNWFPGTKGEGKGKSVDGYYGKYTDAAWENYGDKYLNKEKTQNEPTNNVKKQEDPFANWQLIEPETED